MTIIESGLFLWEMFPPEQLPIWYSFLDVRVIFLQEWETKKVQKLAFASYGVHAQWVQLTMF